jgi:hypothetical protein
MTSNLVQVKGIVRLDSESDNIRYIEWDNLMLQWRAESKRWSLIILYPKCTNTHLHASVISKNFARVILPDPMVVGGDLSLHRPRSAYLLLVRLTMNSCMWIVAVYFWVIILRLNHPDTVEVRPQTRNTVRYGYWKVNIIQIWHESGSLAVLPTFFHRINCHLPLPNFIYRTA